MKAVLAAIVALAVLYLADREFAGGQYTQVTLNVAQQIRQSMGI